MTPPARCPRCPVPPAVRCRGLDVRRFCELIDPSCPQFDPGYLDVILSESYRTDAEPPRPSVAESVALVRGMKACPYRSVVPNSGCGCGRCGLRNGATVSHLECFPCLRQFGLSLWSVSQITSKFPGPPALGEGIGVNLL